jgi:hypothetical protein
VCDLLDCLSRSFLFFFFFFFFFGWHVLCGISKWD